MSTRNRLLSVIGGTAKKYIFSDRPSKLIPFRGEFPLCPIYYQNDYLKAIGNNEFIEDISPEFQELTEKGNLMGLYEDGFKNFLNSFGLSPSDFLKLSNTKKSDYLVMWMEKDGIDISSLTIKMKHKL